MNDIFIEDCRQMIQCPSESGHEKAAADLAKTVMERLGYDRVWIDRVGNVLGLIKGKGPGTILLEGHLDTVGIGNRDDWRFDPHGAIIDNGRIYGRGTSDMKCALMAMIYGAADLIPRKDDLCGDIVVAGVVCEEEFEGVAQGVILDQIKPDLVIIGEASELAVKIGQRGRAEVVVVTHGKSAHSSNPSAGINAVKKMTRLLLEIEALTLPSDIFLGSAIIEVTDIHSEPYPGSSVIPSLCRASLDRRLLPGETEASILNPIREIIQRLKSKDPDFSAEVFLARPNRSATPVKPFKPNAFSRPGGFPLRKNSSKKPCAHWETPAWPKRSPITVFARMEARVQAPGTFPPWVSDLPGKTLPMWWMSMWRSTN